MEYSWCVRAHLLQLCLTLCNPMDYNPSGSSVHGILQARLLEWGAIAFSSLRHLKCLKSIKLVAVEDVL